MPVTSDSRERSGSEVRRAILPPASSTFTKEKSMHRTSSKSAQPMVPSTRKGTESIWPDHFPPDCPGEHGDPTEGIVYQFVRTNPPTRIDVASASEQGKFPDACPCQRVALSCYKDPEHLKQIQCSGGFWASCDIASCMLTPEMGRIKQTGKPKHHSLWLTKTALPVYLSRLEVQE